MMRRLNIIGSGISVLATVIALPAATISVRQQGGGLSQMTTQLGLQLDLEVAVDSEGDELTGVVFFLSFDPEVFSLRPAVDDKPFGQGDVLQGIVLINESEQIDDRIFLTYGEAAGSGEQRRSATGDWVAARFSLDILTRPSEAVEIRVEELGHNRVSHFVSAAEPGTEKRFDNPLGHASVLVTGFRILPLPPLKAVEGQSTVVLDLDDFVEPAGSEVAWDHKRRSEIEIVIDPETNLVTVSPDAGLTDKLQVEFTAMTADNQTVRDTVDIDVISRPRISQFPPTIEFLEDGFNREFDLDARVSDLDDEDSELTWSTAGEVGEVIFAVEAGRIAIFSASQDWNGQQDLQVVVSDADGLADTAFTSVVVTAVNDPPSVLLRDPVYPVKNGGPVVIPLSDVIRDVDDDLNSLQVELIPEGGIRATIVGDSLVIEGEQTGRSILRYSVRDRSGEMAESRLVVVVLAEDGSIGPEISELPKIRLNGGQSCSVDLNRFVQDDSSTALLVWQVASVDSGISTTLVDSMLTVSGMSGFVGTGLVGLTVTDPQGNSDSANQTVQILGPDDESGPEVSTIEKIVVVAGDSVVVQLDDIVDDPDDDDDDISWSFAQPAGFQIELDEDSRTLTITPESDAAPGFIQVPLTASDGINPPVTVDLAVLFAHESGGPQLRAFPNVLLERTGSSHKLDLDNYGFDADDGDAELLWTAQSLAGIEAVVDPVSHGLTLTKVETEAQPSTDAQVAVTVFDTDGNKASGFLSVELPPLFDLGEIPRIEFFSGESDSSLVLDDHVITEGGPLTWEALPSQNFAVRIDTVDASTHRVFIETILKDFRGAETLRFTASDSTDRTRTAFVEVLVKGLGLTPQIGQLPSLELAEGDVNSDIDLDDFVIDDDPTAGHEWIVSGQQTLTVELDTESHVLTLRAEGIEPGLEQIQLLVRDPAGNVGLGILEVVLKLAGSPPVIGSLPQLLLEAGGPEEQLGLSSFVSDEDSPADEITWEVAAPAGLGARIEGSRLFVLAPHGASGTRELDLLARDPDGNIDEAKLQITIKVDGEAPELDLRIDRHSVFEELLELEIQASETLGENPVVRVDGDTLEVMDLGDGKYMATYQFVPREGQNFIDVSVSAMDESGNSTTVEETVAVGWIRDPGGSLSSEDFQVSVNVPAEAAGAGRLAVVKRLDEEETPPDNEGRPAYSLDLGSRELEHPVTVSFVVAPDEAADLGILRWDETLGEWEELPTRTDDRTGLLTAPVEELGIFRVGTVSEEKKLEATELDNYPNPFSPDASGTANIVYEVASPIEVQLVIFNSLGQRVRVLVDEFREPGVWMALWDGRDEGGNRLGSGVYLFELRQGQRRHRNSMMLVR